MNGPAGPDMPGLEQAVRRAFESVHDRAFRGDPAANPRLRVEVVAAALAEDTPAVVLLTPWTCNGLAFPPDGTFPLELEIGGKPRPARSIVLPELGRFWSVNLIPDVSRLDTQHRAVALASSWAEPWADAVGHARRQTA